MVSYEVSIGLILMSSLFCVGSLNFIDIVFFQNFIFFFLPFLPLFLMFLISILAETNRAPFDLPEAESELVSGFNVEYSSMGFALFFLEASTSTQHDTSRQHEQAGCAGVVRVPALS